MKPDAVQSTYRRWAPVYDRTFGAVTTAGRRRTADHVTALGGRVLEVGVGTGLVLPHYGAGVRVTGIDYSTDMLDKARARVNRDGLSHVEALRQMDARTLDFPDGGFDVVVAMHVVSVVPEPERVMAEIARVCRPGGRVLIVNHFSGNRGVLGALERAAAPLEDLLGWQSDFPIDRVLGEPRLREIDRQQLPPLGMMTWLELERRG